MMNRLKDSTSPYLLQHADNPVDWYPWGSEALSRAKAEDKSHVLARATATVGSRAPALGDALGGIPTQSQVVDGLRGDS